MGAVMADDLNLEELKKKRDALALDIGKLKMQTRWAHSAMKAPGHKATHEEVLTHSKLRARLDDALDRYEGLRAQIRGKIAEQYEPVIA